MTELAIGEGRFRLILRALDTDGNGLVVFLTGGDRPHLGGVSLAAPPLAGSGGLSRCDSWDLTLPGHKDKELAARLARQICLAVGEPVSVNVGIHIDAAASEDIIRVTENAEALVRRFIAQYSATPLPCQRTSISKIDMP